MDTERAIEKALRIAARQRRKAWPDGLKLHPATRRLLQDEVRARFGSPRRVSRSWWPRLAWAFGIASAAVLVIWILDRPAGSPQHLAQSTISEPANRPAPAAPAATEEKLMVTRQRSEWEAGSQRDALTTTAPAYQDSAQQPVGGLNAPETKAPQGPAGEGTEMFARRFGSKAETQVAADASDPSPPAQTVLPSAAPGPGLAGTAATSSLEPESRTGSLSYDSLAGADVRNRGAQDAAGPTPPPGAVPDLTLTESTRRAREASALLKAKSLPTVLSSFSVEQLGDSLRIIDADGSVYTGEVAVAESRVPKEDAVSAPQTPAAEAVGGAMRSSPQRSRSLSVPVYSFRVTGTNQSRLQSVSFSGSFRKGTGTGAPPVFTNVYGLPADKAPAQAPTAPEINGRVRLGTGPELEVKAVPKPDR